MEKIQIKEAIEQEKIYIIDNNYKGKEDKLKYFSIKGRIKFISFEKFKLERKDIEDTLDAKYLNNIIGKLEVEYTNMNYVSNSDITNKFYLADEKDNNYETIGTYEATKAIANHLNKDILDIHGYEFIPKIQNRVDIFYLIPNEEMEYYFKLKNGEIEEFQ